jgi:hypothetical protein
MSKDAWVAIMSGWTDPKTQRATAFYCALGIVCCRIWHVGFDKWSAAIITLLATGGTISGIVDVVRGQTAPPGPPPGPPGAGTA